ncbi:MAG: EVE domain-containing protein [Gammaproteobacteria bacterium]|nr:EVE domain-containing protein [Gammaproteobacteria bacterium]
MNYWLFKSEPEEFSIDDLKKRGKKGEHWDGVRNYQARNFMRDDMKTGDLGFFYHSNCDVPGIVGICEIIKEGHVDHTAFDPDDKHYDPKSHPDKPRWIMVDVRFVEKFSTTISLQSLKENPQLADMRLVQKGNRLSVMPVAEKEWKAITKMAR